MTDPSTYCLALVWNLSLDRLSTYCLALVWNLSSDRLALGRIHQGNKRKQTGWKKGGRYYMNTLFSVAQHLI